VQAVLEWLAALPAAVLYLSLCAIAAAENIFPPLPSDTVVAFGTWLAARGAGSPFIAFLATWLGNIAGAVGMYVVGRRHGRAWMHRRFPQLADERGEARLRSLYARYGLLALVVSRFIPGVRALVPPIAGALKVPPVSAIVAMSAASGVWYGVIAYVAYRAGADWEAVMLVIARSGRILAVAACALVIAGGVLWYRGHRRTRSES
jgi:membrane protein DedA with SNARE-associated domain